jgi:hypothetical protein
MNRPQWNENVTLRWIGVCVCCTILGIAMGYGSSWSVSIDRVAYDCRNFQYFEWQDVRYNCLVLSDKRSFRPEPPEEIYR